MPIYLDNAATTKPCAESVEAVVSAMNEHFGNPSSLHKAGLDAQLLVEKSRKTIADAMSCDPSCILFTSGATESNNLALRGASAVYGRRKKKIIVSSVEHASVAETIADLEKNGYEVVRIAPRYDGRFLITDFVDACDDSTCLISMMYVNNENGYILPVKETFKLVKRRFPEIITHCDCVQAFMKIPVKANKLNADLISVSGHKIHAPKGIGALYISPGTRLRPIVTGGKQEKGLRSGTESVPLIAGFAAAVEKLSPTIPNRFEYANRIKSLFFKKLSRIEFVEMNSPENCSPYIFNFSAMGRRSEIMLHFLESKGIYISSGSACSKGAKSGVLSEFGCDQKQVDSALRISISEETTEEDIAAFIKALKEGYEQIRA